MPKTKKGGFILDDSSCDPYGTTEMRQKMQGGGKKSKATNTPKKSETGKKK